MQEGSGIGAACDEGSLRAHPAFSEAQPANEENNDAECVMPCAYDIHKTFTIYKATEAKMLWYPSQLLFMLKSVALVSLMRGA